MSGRTYYVDGNGVSHQIKKMFYVNGSGDATQIKKDFFEDKNTFSSAHNVVFHIDTNNTQTVEIDDGQDVIANAPTATKSGWTFRGWREDATATTAVVSSKVCDNDSIVMYAVFQRTLTISYNGNGATSGSTSAQTGTQYYNNGNYANPTFTIRSNGFAKANAVSGNIEYKYSFAYWRLNSTSGTAYGAGASYTASGNATFYAQWTATAVKTYLVRNGVSQVAGCPASASAATGAAANFTGVNLASYSGKTMYFQFRYVDGGSQVVYGGTWLSLGTWDGQSPESSDSHNNVQYQHSSSGGGTSLLRGYGSGWAQIGLSASYAYGGKIYPAWRFGETGASGIAIVFNNVWIE